jgi:hypothetical protein
MPNRTLSAFGFQTARQTYDTGNFTVAGGPSADGREATLWSLDANGNVTITATAKFA